MLNAAYLGVMRMATPTSALLQFGTAHSRANNICSLSWAIVPMRCNGAHVPAKLVADMEVVPRKESEVESCESNALFAVRGWRSRAFGSHSLRISSESYNGGFRGSWCMGPFRAEYSVLSGSHNKSFQRTPITPRPAANAFGILSQRSAPRSAPLNSALAFEWS